MEFDYDKEPKYLAYKELINLANEIYEKLTGIKL
mgnify:CR=1 FL=1